MFRNTVACVWAQHCWVVGSNPSSEAEAGCLLFKPSSDEALRGPGRYTRSSAHSRLVTCQAAHVGGLINPAVISGNRNISCDLLSSCETSSAGTELSSSVHKQSGRRARPLLAMGRRRDQCPSVRLIIATGCFTHLPAPWSHPELGPCCFCWRGQRAGRFSGGACGPEWCFTSRQCSHTGPAESC